MNTNPTPSSSPLLIGGSSSFACHLLGDYVKQLTDYDCGPQTNVLCHPKIWQGAGKDWSRLCIKSLENPDSKEIGILPWRKVRPENAQYLCLQGQTIYDLLEASSDGADFAERLYRNRLIISAKNSWADATPDNCFAAKLFLDSIPNGQFLFVVESAYSAMPRLIKEGFSPKVAAKIWVIESALATALLKIDQASGRVHIVRLEDLLSEPIASLKKITQFLTSSDSANLPKISQLETMPALEREKLLFSLADLQANLSPHHRDYLLGTTLKPDVLSKFGYQDITPSGAELLYGLGYENSIPNWNSSKLSKEEQQLRSPRASFINPLADFKKAPENTSSPKRGKDKSGKSRLGFWKTSKKSSATIEFKKSFSNFPLWTPLSSTELEFNNETDLAPELIEGDLDFAVVIAFSGRHEVLGLVVRELARLRENGFSIAVFLACSDTRDFCFARELREELGCIGVKSVPNRPLGRKWQAGVNFARQSHPKNLLITGSDDLVSMDYLTYAAKLLTESGPNGGFDFAAPASWFLYEIGDESELQGSLWELAYRNPDPTPIPIGAGRVYSSRLLDRFDWELFDDERNSGLDMQGYLQVISTNGRPVLIPPRKGMLLSVKGNWQALNPTEKILSVATIQSRSCDFEKEQLFEKHFQTTSSAICNSVQPSH